MIDLTVWQPDPKSRPHAEASPTISLHVLAGLVTAAQADGVTHLSIADLQRAVNRYRGAHP